MQLKQVPGAVTNLQQVNTANPNDRNTYYGYGAGKKRCWKDSLAALHIGLDPLAWAYILWHWTPDGYYYDDYSFTTAYSGTRTMINQLYDYNTSPGALVNAGHHAMVLKGATTSCNPADEMCRYSNPGYSIVTVYVDDPWYDRSDNDPGQGNCSWNGQPYTCGKYGLHPSTAITYGTWVAYYYTPWTAQDCSYWNGDYVAVLRRGTAGQPSLVGGSLPGSMPVTKDASTAPTTDKTYGEEWPEPTPTSTVVAASQAIVDLDSAFATAKTRNGLDRRAQFADATGGGHVTSTYPVHSLVSNFPDYVLASVVGDKGLRGVAMFTLERGGPVFAGMVATPQLMGHFPAVDEAGARSAATAAGFDTRDRAELVWGWSAESNSPFQPFYRVSVASGYVYVDLSGAVFAELHLQAPPKSR